MVKESDIKEYMLAKAKEHNVLARKVTWEGRDNAPDWVLMKGGPSAFSYGRTLWVELKRPGEEPNTRQKREHERMRQHGQFVLSLDTFDDVDAAFEWLTA